MRRTIDADALIDKYGDWYTEEGTEEGYIGTIKGIVDSMPTIEPEPKWIPFMRRKPNVREKEVHPEWEYVLCGRLPKDGQRVLVNIKYKGHESVQIDTYYEDFGEHYLDSAYDLCTEATAWMPLPEPYEEGGE